jgi:hypothetical protein
MLAKFMANNDVMKKAMSLVFMISLASIIYGQVDSVALGKKSRELYFKVDKSFAGAKAEVFDSTGILRKSEILKEGSAIVSFNLPEANYFVRITKDNHVREFYWNTQYSVWAGVTLRKSYFTVDISFSIPEHLGMEQELVARERVSEQLQTNLDLARSHDSQAGTFIDLKSDREFVLEIDSDLKDFSKESFFASFRQVRKMSRF